MRDVLCSLDNAVNKACFLKITIWITMLPIHTNGCLEVAIGFSYGIFVAVDNLGISLQRSHKKPSKTPNLSCSSGLSAPTKNILLIS